MNVGVVTTRDGVLSPVSTSLRRRLRELPDTERCDECGCLTDIRLDRVHEGEITQWAHLESTCRYCGDSFKFGVGGDIKPEALKKWPGLRPAARNK